MNTIPLAPSSMANWAVLNGSLVELKLQLCGEGVIGLLDSSLRVVSKSWVPIACIFNGA